ncbi:flagellar basal body-associated FliL family protein [uncultured Sulfitobacter sp.]|uniref:flagellar basal body-associated FliL family protein n=1 Tax=uncultured Sulfitobacter sp. TaxID=191468 RepID=UPI0026062C0C|nr:flagellar basal body-associated FliL family protein [uncultured Sulfitobacter sp.]
MKKLLPLVLLLIGAGAGVGAGIFLRPDQAPLAEATDMDPAKNEAGTDDKESGDTKKATDKENDEKEAATAEFVKLNNQFVVPIVAADKVTALVVLALSIEVPAGKTDTVYLREPKLRDSFLQVLFDHANMGGFEGNFTNAKVLGRLRAALLEVAQKDLGKDVANDVLIIEIARQDY